MMLILSPCRVGRDNDSMFNRVDETILVLGMAERMVYIVEDGVGE